MNALGIVESFDGIGILGEVLQASFRSSPCGSTFNLRHLDVPSLAVISHPGEGQAVACHPISIHVHVHPRVFSADDRGSVSWGAHGECILHALAMTVGVAEMVVHAHGSSNRRRCATKCCNFGCRLGLSDLKVDEVETELADIFAHGANFEVAGDLHVFGDGWSVGFEICDVFVGVATAFSLEITTDTKAGRAGSRLDSALLSAFSGCVAGSLLAVSRGVTRPIFELYYVHNR